MYKLRIIRAEGTIFKGSTSNSSQLPAAEKYEVGGPAIFDVLHYEVVENNHYIVNFANELGEQQRNTWYVYRPHVYVEEVVDTPYTLEISRNSGTVLKASTQDSSSLPPEQKQTVAGLIDFRVHEYEPAARNHYKIKLSGKLGDKQNDTWYVYAPHISMKPEIMGCLRYYTVQPGDSLTKIAAQFYGNADYWCSLYAANYNTIGTNPHMLRAGLRLCIPGLEGVAMMSTTETEALSV